VHAVAIKAAVKKHAHFMLKAFLSAAKSGAHIM
jgi:hypothetical protein